MLSDKLKAGIAEQKGPATKTAYRKGLTDCQDEVLINLKRLRRKTKHWRGVNKAIDLIENLKPEENK